MENTVAVVADKQLPYTTVEQFLKHIERRAFHMARLGTGNADSAMDIVQDSMYKLGGKIFHQAATGMEATVLSHTQQQTDRLLPPQSG